MVLFLGFYIFSGSEGSVAEWLERWSALNPVMFVSRICLAPLPLVL